MRFTIDGRTYAIEFQREYHERIRWNKGTKTNVYSKYPYTTANIREVQDGVKNEEWPIHRTYTVGCNYRDRFDREAGRIAALRMICMGNSLTKAFKAAIWATYLGR